MFKKAIYWIRYVASAPFLWIGFKIEDLGTFVIKRGISLQRVGDKLQDLAVAIEGDIPEGCEEQR